MTQNALAMTVLVGVLAAIGFLALKAATGGIEDSDYITAPAVAIGAAIGYHYGVRRRERKERRRGT